MRFVLCAAALDGEEELLCLVDRLVDRVADNAHRIEITDMDLLEESAWYKNARQSRRKLLIEAVSIPPRKHANPGDLHVKQIEIRDISEARVADKLAHTPLTILVEDREADGILLDILVEEIGSPELQTLWKQGHSITPPAFEFESSGGIGSMAQRIDRAVAEAAQQGRPLRLFVICDSDQRWPGESHGVILKLNQKCAELAISLHVLRKRNCENYIPDAVFEAARDDPQMANHTHRFDALLRRNRAQRDHFPIKDGLKTDERTNAINAGLYQQAELADLMLLEVRLFPKSPRPLLLLSQQRRNAFTAAGLRERDGNGELDTLVNDIAREL